MAKRFTATEIWDEDWFLDMPNEYKLFWFYLLATCDHAGLFKVNLRSFCGLNGVKLSSTKALEYFNTGKQRIRVLKENIWLVEDFFVFQYGVNFNLKNRVHNSILELYSKLGVNLRSIRGLIEVTNGVKDKDKDKDIEEECIKEGLLGEIEQFTPSGWNRKPSENEMNLTLPSITSGAVIELFYYSKKQVISEKDVLDMWSVFKKQNFNGIKPYNSPEESYSHFIHWSKTQSINGTHQQSAANGSTKLGTSDARIQRAKEF